MNTYYYLYTQAIKIQENWIRKVEKLAIKKLCLRAVITTANEKIGGNVSMNVLWIYVAAYYAALGYERFSLIFR